MHWRTLYLAALATALLPACAAGPTATTTPATDAGAAPTSTGLSTAPYRSVRLFFDNGGCRGDAQTERRVAALPDPATAALTALFAGPTKAESERGLTFITQSSDLLRSVRVHDGTAYVDLTESFVAINNVSTSCAGQSFLASVENTLMQFSEVRRVRYAVEEDPAAFHRFMQQDCPEPCDPSLFRHRG